jgi:hypothetical protein
MEQFGGGKHTEQVELPASSTLGELLARYDLDTREGLVYLVDGRRADTGTSLEQNSLISVLYQPQGG